MDEVERSTKVSKRIDKFGAEWFISVKSQSNETDGEEYLNVYLHAEHTLEHK